MREQRNKRQLKFDQALFKECHEMFGWYGWDDNSDPQNCVRLDTLERVDIEVETMFAGLNRTMDGLCAARDGALKRQLWTVGERKGQEAEQKRKKYSVG